MSDKERLQRLKRLNNLSNVWEYLEQTTLYDGNALKESWEWLISQAEKVEQLQQENERLKAIIAEGNDCPECGITIRRTLFSGPSELEEKLQLSQKRISHIEKQLQQAQTKIERYEKALEFYADEEHYKEKLISEAQCDADGIWISNDVYVPPIIYFDNGEKARQALKGESQ